MLLTPPLVGLHHRSLCIPGEGESNGIIPWGIMAGINQGRSILLYITAWTPSSKFRGGNPEGSWGGYHILLSIPACTQSSKSWGRGILEESRGGRNAVRGDYPSLYTSMHTVKQITGRGNPRGGSWGEEKSQEGETWGYPLFIPAYTRSSKSQRESREGGEEMPGGITGGRNPWRQWPLVLPATMPPKCWPRKLIPVNGYTC